MYRRRRHSGFTLVELLVVILIVGVLAAIALPRFLGQRTRTRNSAAQVAVRHALVAARSWYAGDGRESYAGLCSDAGNARGENRCSGKTAISSLESSLGRSEPADTQAPGSSADPQNIWIGNGSDGTDPTGGTITLCSVSRGDSTYCVRDVDGVTTYLLAQNVAVGSLGSGSLYGSGGWSPSSTITSAAPVAGTPTVTGTAQHGLQLQGSAGTWSAFPAITSWSWVWRRCNSSGASCSDIAGTSGTASGSSPPSIPSYTLAAADVGSTIRLQVAATNSVNTTTVSSSQTAVVTTLAACGSGLSDTFDGAGGTLLSDHLSDSGHSWTLHPVSINTASLSGSGAMVNNTSYASDYVSSCVPPSADYSVQATAYKPNANDGTYGYVRLWARMDPTARTGYLAMLSSNHNGGPAGVYLYRYLNGTSTHLANWAGGIGAANALFPGALSVKITVSGNDITVSYKTDTGSWNTPIAINDTQISAANSPGAGIAASGAVADAFQINVISSAEAAAGAVKNLTAPSISGTPASGQTLTANIGTWSGSPTYSWKWVRCSSGKSDCNVTYPVSSGTGSTVSNYTLGPGDVGYTICLYVVGTNGVDSLTAASNATAAVS